MELAGFGPTKIGLESKKSITRRQTQGQATIINKQSRLMQVSPPDQQVCQLTMFSQILGKRLCWTRLVVTTRTASQEKGYAKSVMAEYLY